jgi:gamma-glutamyltranspeptidase/glutathione hydrolase
MATSDHNGAVAAGHDLTAETARQVLAEGGNAADAAIAGLWTACLAEPVLASPGGGGFAMIFDPTAGRTELLDFFAQTPQVKKPPSGLDFHPALADFGPATQEFHIGHGAAATPGMVPGLFALSEQFGTRAMGDLLKPALKLAKSGFEVTPFQAFLFEVVAPILTASDSARRIFAPEGRLLQAGERLLNPGLGLLFEGLAKHGLSAYLDGPVAAAMINAQSAGGQLSHDDLAAYRVVTRKPITSRFDHTAISLNPPPAASGVLIAYMLTRLATNEADGPLSLARAMADCDRLWRQTDGDIASIMAALGLDDEPVAPPASSFRGTTHISVIDRTGLAVAITVSNGEGNGHVIGDYGFMLNNMLGEEDINRRGFHNWPENTRLSSMMAPSLIAFDDGGMAALGSGGSNRIRSAVFSTAARLAAGIDPAGSDPAEAVEAARLHVEAGHLDFEDLMGKAVRSELDAEFDDRRAWHEQNLFFGGVHVVMRRADGSFAGAGDPRRAGVYLTA